MKSLWKKRCFKYSLVGFGLLVACFLGLVVFVWLQGSREPKQPIRVTRVAVFQTLEGTKNFYRKCGRFPDNGDELLRPPPACKGASPFVRYLPMDGWEIPLKFRPAGDSMTVISLGADNKEGGEGASADISETWTAKSEPY
ncbi:MAG: hypothetical protein C5B49_14610 [Bdellovibrio sp.]|nr:MAG: hypothetical protein C5B49_14610 [Bdellovibrio sp.]